MVTIAIKTEETVVTALQEIARQRKATVEEIAREALQQYLQNQAADPSRPYSFIGIGRSGKKNISTQVEKTLSQIADRREGWSLTE